MTKEEEQNMIKEHFALKGYIEKHYGVKIVTKTFRAKKYYFVLERHSFMGDMWWELKYNEAFDGLDDVYDRLKITERRINE